MQDFTAKLTKYLDKRSRPQHSQNVYNEQSESFGSEDLILHNQDPNAHKSSITSVTTTYTVLVTDEKVLCNGTFNVTLFSVVGYEGKVITITNTGTGIITVLCNGAETIDGETSQNLYDGDSIDILCTTTGWIII